MKKLIVTFGGVGLVPGAPGTYGSLAAAVLYYLLWLWLGPWGMIPTGRARFDTAGAIGQDHVVRVGRRLKGVR